MIKIICDNVRNIKMLIFTIRIIILSNSQISAITKASNPKYLKRRYLYNTQLVFIWIYLFYSYFFLNNCFPNVLDDQIHN